MGGLFRAGWGLCSGLRPWPRESEGIHEDGVPTSSARARARSTAVVPLQRVQWHEFPRTTRDVYDFREGDAMVSLLRDLEHMAVDPSCGADKDRKSGRRPLGLHLLE